MIRPERGRVRDADGQVSDDGEDAVGARRAEGEVVADLVDREEQVLVRGRAEHVGREEEGWREEWGVPEEDGEGELQSEDEDDEVFG